MKYLQSLFLFGLISLTTACTTTAPIVLKGSAFESKSLAEAVGNQRVAINGQYKSTRYGGREDTAQQYCADIEQKRVFETTLLPWAPNQTNWQAIKPTDIKVSYAWTCDSIYTDSVGASAVMSLLSLGLASAKQDLRLRLSVRIHKSNKEIFKGNYEKRDVIGTGLSDKSFTEGVRGHFFAMSELLMETFVKELDRDGALDK